MTRQDILDLLRMPWTELRPLADRVRTANVGRTVRVRGLIEFSSLCRRNCLYCGLRRPNRGLARYTLTKATILACAAEAHAAGVDTFVLQSGEWPREPAWLADIVADLKARFGLAVTLSVGECPKEHYALWREAGADRFLIKHETASPELYARLHPGHCLEERLDALRTLKELGYETGSGFIVGLPGQTPDILAEDILLVRELGVDMCGAGPFVPQAATPLAHEPRGDVDLSLRVLAALRVALPRANLPATTALATLSPVQGQRDGLAAGANVLMPSFTPGERRKSYRIYDNKARVDMDSVRSAIAGAGLVCDLDENRKRRQAAPAPCDHGQVRSGGDHPCPPSTRKQPGPDACR